MKNNLALLLCASALHPAPRFENTLEAQKAEITRLTGLLKTATETIAARDNTLLGITSERDTATAQVTALNGQLKTANETLADRNASIIGLTTERDDLKAAATTVEKKAAQLLASQGHAPLALGGTENPTGEKGKSLQEQYSAITDVTERAAFFKKHADKL